jgi:two-component system response regulator
VNQRTLLLVEDSQDDEELALRSLRQAGIDCRIDVARDGEQALDHLFGKTRNGPPPILILLDLKSPKVSGFEILRRVREDPGLRCVPVVVLSSSDAHEDIARAYELGANSYVRKPIEFTRYTEVLRQVGRYWFDLNETLDATGPV